MIQYTNGSKSRPVQGDIIVFKGTLWNRFGHVAIVAQESITEIEIIQQNPGPFSSSRERLPITNKNNRWTIENDRVLGWLRKE